MRVLLVAVLCAGCGRTSLPSSSPVPQLQEPSPPTLGGIEQSAWSWSQPELATDVDALLDSVRVISNSNTFDPVLSEDGLSLFVTTDVGGSFDVYELTRPAVGASFDHITLLGDDVNVPGGTVFGYQPLASLNTVMALGDFPVAGVPAGTLTVVFADTTVAPLQWQSTALDLAYTNIMDPRLTGGGDALIFASSGTDGVRSLYLAQRATVDEDFDTGTRVEGLTTADVSAPWLSPDRRVLLFAHREGESMDASDLWSATRLDANAPFTNAGPLGQLSSAFFDGEPYVFESGDTCELFFIAQRPENPGFRLYRSTLLR